MKTEQLDTPALVVDLDIFDRTPRRTSPLKSPGAS
jgi:D-serine deaminase-like pyridoxal phosphate-dependent protein